jgi:hypothetical protein
MIPVSLNSEPEAMLLPVPFQVKKDVLGTFFYSYLDEHSCVDGEYHGVLPETPDILAPKVNYGLANFLDSCSLNACSV